MQFPNYETADQEKCKLLYIKNLSNVSNQQNKQFHAYDLNSSSDIPQNIQYITKILIKCMQ